MRALVYDGALRLETNYPVPAPGSDEARVQVSIAGICATDVHILAGYAQFEGVPGHEFVGVVDRARDPALVGRRVVGEINVACGTCAMCVAGRPSHCVRRTAIGIRGRDGALAEYLTLPVRNLHPVPEAMPDEVAVFAEPLAAACRVLAQVHVGPDDRAIVLGDGRLGLLVAQTLALTGCRLLAIGRHASHLALLEARGIDTCLADENAAGDADVVVECTGSSGGFEVARSLVRPGGTLVLKSTYPGLAEVDLSALVVDEVRVIGSRCGPLPAALRLLARGLVDVGPMVEAVYGLDDALVAFEHASRPGVLKVLIRP
jgi:threonine dehydrogenase-like Zn-dependent dehydrogenase